MTRVPFFSKQTLLLTYNMVVSVVGVFVSQLFAIVAAAAVARSCEGRRSGSSPVVAYGYDHLPSLCNV